MQTSLPATLAATPTPVAPPPAVAAPVPGSTQAVDSGGVARGAFARMLQQQRADDRAAERRNEHSAPGATRARAAGRPAPDEHATTDAEGAADDTATALDPALAAILSRAGADRPAPAATPTSTDPAQLAARHAALGAGMPAGADRTGVATGTAETTQPGDAGGAGAKAAPRAGGRGRRDAADAAAASGSVDDTRSAPARGSEPGPAPAGFDAALAAAHEAAGSAATRPAAPAANDGSAAAAVLATPAPGVRDTDASPPPLPVSVGAPLDAPEFAQHLGVQISLLARGGVQHAELRLNPAEMGPVAVQIALDGASARVDFGADLAATREVLQHSLPALAAALRDCGFTLAGGGVSARGGGGASGDRQDSEPGPHGPQRARRADLRVGADGGASVPLAAPRRLVRAGSVDLYA